MAARVLLALLPLAAATLLQKVAPPPLLASLASRGVTEATPIQAAVLGRALAGDCLLIHAETGSGKTLAYLLPAFARAIEAGAESRVLILSPTRELAVQLADEASQLIRAGALGDAAAAVALVAPGHEPKIDALLAARVIVATPPEFSLLLAEPDTRPPLAPRRGAGARAGGGGARGAEKWVGGIPPGFLDEEEEEEKEERAPGPPSNARRLADCLAAHVTTLVLDECDALVPGLKVILM